LCRGAELQWNAPVGDRSSGPRADAQRSGTVRLLPQLLGDEAFSIGGTVRDFWSCAMSDLQSNATRGHLAEFLVAPAVGATGTRVEWDAFDVQAPTGRDRGED
jgi:hypothetical protein